MSLIYCALQINKYIDVVLETVPFSKSKSFVWRVSGFSRGRDNRFTVRIVEVTC